MKMKSAVLTLGLLAGILFSSCAPGYYVTEESHHRHYRGEEPVYVPPPDQPYPVAQYTPSNKVREREPSYTPPPQTPPPQREPQPRVRVQTPPKPSNPPATPPDKRVRH